MTKDCSKFLPELEENDKKDEIIDDISNDNQTIFKNDSITDNT